MRDNMQRIFEYIKQQINDLDIFKVISNDNKDLYTIRNSLSDCEKILVFGIGGSSLGGKCLVKFGCIMDDLDERVVFIENVDPISFLRTINRCNQDKTGIIVISKSGKTTETLMLFLTLVNLWKDFDHKRRTVVITENSENNPLRDIAFDLGARILDHHKNIGGRYSVFSNVGLLPAVLNDINIESFLDGAKTVITEILETQDIEDCPIVKDIYMMDKAFNTKSEHVVMCYSDAFIEYGKWYSQLLSESLGKDGFGITPIPATGTVDQHSLLQLFMGGPKNKLFTIITQKRQLETPKITSKYSAINNHNIADLMVAHQHATIETIKKIASVRVLNFEQFSVNTLGFLMALSFVEIIMIGQLHDINPFDQPNVEEQKVLVQEYLKVQ